MSGPGPGPGFRCACADTLDDATEPPRWPNRQITWHQAVALSQLPPDAVAGIFRLAWSQWAAVAGIQPLEATTTPVNVSARNGDGLAEGFDLGNSILAWSQLPVGATAGTQLCQVFNDHEDWTPALLLAVACHEIGHALGLAHDTDPAALLYPYVNTSITAPQPPDIAKIQALYGPPLATPPGAPAPTPAPVTPSNAATIEFDAPAAGRYRITLVVESVPLTVTGS